MLIRFSAFAINFFWNDCWWQRWRWLDVAFETGSDALGEAELEKLRQFDLDWRFGPCTGTVPDCASGLSGRPLSVVVVFLILKVNIYREILCRCDGSFCLLLCRNHSPAEVGESPTARPQPPRGRQRAAAAGTHAGQAWAQVQTIRIIFTLIIMCSYILNVEHLFYRTHNSIYYIFTRHDGKWS